MTLEERRQAARERIQRASEHRVSQKWRGLGDVVASATKAIGIKPCGGCTERQKWLNKLVPFKDSSENTPAPE